MASNLDPGLVDPCIRMIVEIQVLGPKARIGSVLLIYIYQEKPLVIPV